MISAVVLFCIAVNQINPCDYGAVPNDGRDDSAAFVKAYQVAMETGGVVSVPEGVFDLSPLSISVFDDLEIVGAGKTKTILRRMENRSWTQRFRCKDGAWLRLAGLTLDGNAASLPRVQGQDQHHEIRIDRLAESAMRGVELDSIGVQNLIADGIQFVHNGLERVVVDDFEFLGGAKGRRNLQFSYHPKSALVRNSSFRDFSTEPAGGTKNRINLRIEDCTISGACNLQECGDLQARRLNIHRLATLTCDSGIAEELQVASTNTIVGPSKILIRDSQFTVGDKPLKFRARFTRHDQNVIFERCQFPVQPDTQVIFTTEPPDAGQEPEGKITFRDCRFSATAKAALLLNQGYGYRVEECVFSGAVGIIANARFGPKASLVETGNTWAGTSIKLEQVSSGSPFELTLAPETLKRLTGKGDEYPLTITEGIE